jgi:V/A-type H+/Na+-transporting ATPase subunit I
MLRAVPMVHFRVQVPSRDAAAATRAIAGEGLLHLVDIAHGRAPYDSAPPGTRELYATFRDLLRRIQTVAQQIGVTVAEPEGSVAADDIADFDAERLRISAILEPIEHELQDLSRKRAEVRERLANLRQRQAALERFARSETDTGRLADCRFAALRLVNAQPEALETIGGILSPAPWAIVPLDHDSSGILAAVITAAFAKARLDEAIRIANALPVSLPSKSEDLDRDHIAAEIATAEDGERTVRDGTARVKETNGATVAALLKRVEVATLLLQAQTFFAAAGRFVVISGWVPADSAGKLRDRIKASTGDRAIIEISAAEHVSGVGEGVLRVPILHRNPLVLRPFQKLIDLYGTPSYTEVQPTAFFAISFLLMFGLMFGDVGHGAVLFTAGWLLFRYMPRFLDYGILLMEAGTASAIFGCLYGSVFGFHGIVPTLWLEPIHDLSRFMGVAIAFGIVVITTGLLLNVVNAWRSGDVRGALFGTKGLMGALLYWVTLVLIARAFVPSSLRVPGWIIVALCAAAGVLLLAGPFIVRRFEKHADVRPKPIVRTTPVSLVLLERSIELVDTLFSYFANTISFVRVAAFAAVHAGVFIALFAITDSLAGVQFGGVLSIVVHVAGNALIILLEGLTVSVQVLRLEYYEFFGKFFRGGGESYAPLMLRQERKYA